MIVRTKVPAMSPRTLLFGWGAKANADAGEHGLLLRPHSPFDLALLGLLAAVLAAVGFAAVNMTYQAGIICALVLAATLVLLSGAAGIRWGFLFWISTLALGYRTIRVTNAFRIHPGEVVLWGLLFWLIGWIAVNRRTRVGFWLPWWLWAFIPFAAWGWIAGQYNGLHWDVMLNEARNFVLLIPLYLLVSQIVVGTTRWRSVLLAFYVVATGIAALGLVEYVFPGVTTIFPQFITHPDAMETGEGFARARFSFWGGAVATYSCVLAVPFAIPLWRWWDVAWARALVLAAQSVLLAGLYVGGFRVFWLMLAMQCVLFLLLTRRYLLVPVLIVAAIGGYQLLPAATQERLHTLELILTGQPVDTSGIKHVTRPKMALELVASHPEGSGWGAAGWVHSDFILVAANLGVLAGILFLAGYLMTVIRVWRRVNFRARPRAEWELDLAVLLALLTAGGILCTQAVVVLPQLAFPIWLVWVLADVRAHEVLPNTHNLVTVVR